MRIFKYFMNLQVFYEKFQVFYEFTGVLWEFTSILWIYRCSIVMGFITCYYRFPSIIITYVVFARVLRPASGAKWFRGLNLASFPSPIRKKGSGGHEILDSSRVATPLSCGTGCGHARQNLTAFQVRTSFAPIHWEVDWNFSQEEA